MLPRASTKIQLSLDNDLCELEEARREHEQKVI